MVVQDKLHQNLCRQRSLVAIGTHDLATLQAILPPAALICLSATNHISKRISQEHGRIGNDWRIYMLLHAILKLQASKYIAK